MDSDKFMNELFKELDEKEVNIFLDTLKECAFVEDEIRAEERKIYLCR